MSIDKLQEKIRKYKNPSIVEFNADISLIPGAVLEEEGGIIPAFDRYFGELLECLKDVVPAVRFSFSSFALLGGDGLTLLRRLMTCAGELGHYVLLDAPVSYTMDDAARAANSVFGQDSLFPCDGVIVCPYIGADGVKPYTDFVKSANKTVFAVLRTGNKSAAQLQDLLTGSRLVHIALADVLNRLAEPLLGRVHYSGLGCVGSAASADSLRTLRGKYKNLFILAEGYDYSNANAKNCSYAFDPMGHGAIVCAGTSVTGAWKDSELDYKQAALEAAERMKKNLLRYITVL